MEPDNQTPLKLFVTGASGFVGLRVLTQAHNKGYELVAQSRSKQAYTFEQVLIDITPETDWQSALVGVDCVVHCAARVHQMQETEEDALKAYRDVNTQGTLNLARQAVSAGVKRFIFLSSIKVNGEQTQVGSAFQYYDPHIPVDPYGLSKYEAEQQLLALAEQTDLEVVIIRPPLVYGEGVKANFLSMMNWVKKQIPLPLGAVRNQRSLVYLDNLVDLILVCCQHPKAAGEIFLVSDNHDVSLTALLRAIAQAMQIRPRLLPIPQTWLQSLLSLLGKPELGQRLCGNLQLDITHTQKTLNWSPPVSFEQGIKRTVNFYLSQSSK
ncbi:NAD-dependent dehydratase [Vibrio cholerae]|uniref:UDP-glucose 4-epimerase family protein n=1 Tax=Vibrio cholerae TaxID=666 RepID=UPI000C7EE8F2|nr:SDR family oxidoreductase [Vibrio cholerae]PKQ53378.1 NAD-dependent dehydratase [Vibrio cholerae]